MKILTSDIKFKWKAKSSRRSFKKILTPAQLLPWRIRNAYLAVFIDPASVKITIHSSKKLTNLDGKPWTNREKTSTAPILRTPAQLPRHAIMSCLRGVMSCWWPVSSLKCDVITLWFELNQWHFIMNNHRYTISYAVIQTIIIVNYNPWNQVLMLLYQKNNVKVMKRSSAHVAPPRSWSMAHSFRHESFSSRK